MHIAIIGAGSVGATLGRTWIEHGEDVIWGLRNPADPKYAALPKERVKAPAEAVNEAEVVVIATPWSATEAASRSAPVGSSAHSRFPLRTSHVTAASEASASCSARPATLRSW